MEERVERRTWSTVVPVGGWTAMVSKGLAALERGRTAESVRPSEEDLGGRWGEGGEGGGGCEGVRGWRG